MENTKLLENTARWRKTKRGLVTNLFSQMKSRKHTTITLEYLHEFSKCKKFDRLFDEWTKSGYNKQLKPSIDRINCKIGYAPGNIHWLTWAENRYKQVMERRIRNGAVVQKLGDKVVARYVSQREAVIKTGLSQGNISMVLSGKRKTTGGYVFAYD